MRFDDDILKYYWEDNDNQDGKYYSSYEKFIPVNDEAEAYDTFDIELEEKKWKAVLYLHMNSELLNDKIYLNIYNYIIDEKIREFELLVYGKCKKRITEKDREIEIKAIDNEIKMLGEKRIMQYKKTALYIVDYITDLIKN